MLTGLQSSRSLMEMLRREKKRPKEELNTFFLFVCGRDREMEYQLFIASLERLVFI